MRTQFEGACREAATVTPRPAGGGRAPTRPAARSAAQSTPAHHLHNQGVAHWEGREVDTIPGGMDACGDKLVTTPGESPRPPKRRAGEGKGGPAAVVRCGSAVVPVYRLGAGGRTRFVIAFYRDGARVRQAFRTLEAARKETLLAAQRIQGGRQEMNDIRPADREAYHAALGLLEPTGVPLVSAIQEYVRAARLLDGTPLLPAVEEFTRRARGMKLGVRTPAVVEELVASKRQDGVSHRYLLQLQSNLRRFASDFPGPISHILRDQIDDWLRARGVATRSRNALLATIRVLFSFAKKRSYLPANEVSEAEALDKVRTGDLDTQIFSPGRMRTILHAAPPRLVPILAIGAFAGMRKAEMDRLDWNAVDLERRIIEVRAGQAKTASRRLIPISANLAAWLEPLERTGPVVADEDFHRQITALAAALGVQWPRNVLRHSFISYRIAIVKSADQVALEAGNSPAVIFKHYRELATPEQAREWFSILPKEGQWANEATYVRSRRTVVLHEAPRIRMPTCPACA